MTDRHVVPTTQQETREWERDYDGVNPLLAITAICAGIGSGRIDSSEGAIAIGRKIDILLKRVEDSAVERERRRILEAMAKVLDEQPPIMSVDELLPIMGSAYNDLSVQVAYKEGYNEAVRELHKVFKKLLPTLSQPEREGGEK